MFNKIGTLHTRRSRLAGVAAIFALFSVASNSESLGTVALELSGLAESSGSVYIAVYNSQDNWLGDDLVADATVVIEESRQGELVQTQLQLPLGDYAISLFYDRNGNGELDTNFMGMPKEPMALSNNAKPKFGPPKYEDAVFSVGVEPTVQKLLVEKL